MSSGQRLCRFKRWVNRLGNEREKDERNGGIGNQKCVFQSVIFLCSNDSLQRINCIFATEQRLITLKITMTNVTKYWKKAGMPLLLFYAIAVACRLVSLYVLPRLFPDSCCSIALQLCEGVGPALGAVVVMGIFKKKFFCSIAGKSYLSSG